MQELVILNSKEKKEFVKLLNYQWGCEISKEFIFFRSSKDKIYLIDEKFKDFDLENLRLDRIGLYFGTYSKSGFRLSIEGSQIIGEIATKNILTLNSEQFKKWIAGEDLEFEDEPGIYIVKNEKNDIMGCGILTHKKDLLNQVPKSRRIRTLKQL